MNNDGDEAVSSGGNVYLFDIEHARRPHAQGFIM